MGVIPVMKPLIVSASASGLITWVHSILLDALLFYPHEEIGNILYATTEVVIFSHTPLLSLERRSTSLYMEQLLRTCLFICSFIHSFNKHLLINHGRNLGTKIIHFLLSRNLTCSLSYDALVSSLSFIIFPIQLTLFSVLSLLLDSDPQPSNWSRCQDEWWHHTPDPGCSPGCGGDGGRTDQLPSRCECSGWPW